MVLAKKVLFGIFQNLSVLSLNLNVFSLLAFVEARDNIFL